MTSPHAPRCAQQGTSLVEVLVTVLILAFGLIGIAIFQTKSQIGSVESYQRAQAVILLDDMRARITANSDSASEYAGTTVLGTGHSTDTSCTGATAGSARDLCEWSLALRGAAEKKGNTSVGAMAGARGCITQVQAENSATGVCQPAIYQLAVAWQGLHQTRAPSLSCASGSFGTDSYRRAIGLRVTVALPRCRSLGGS